MGSLSVIPADQFLIFDFSLILVYYDLFCTPNLEDVRDQWRVIGCLISGREQRTSVCVVCLVLIGVLQLTGTNR